MIVLLVCLLVHAMAHVAQRDRIENVYAFKSRRTSDGGSTPFVTLVANVGQLLQTQNGPLYSPLNDELVYQLHVDNDGDAREDVTFQFFTQVEVEELTVDVPINDGDVVVRKVSLGHIGPIEADHENVNVRQYYNVRVQRGDAYRGNVNSDAAQFARRTGDTSSPPQRFEVPYTNAGEKTFANVPYNEYFRAFVYDVELPNCAQPAQLFVGPRRESYAAQPGPLYDLLNFQDIATENFGGVAEGSENPLDLFTTTSFVLEVHQDCLLRDGSDNDVLGVWASIRHRRTQPSAQRKRSVLQELTSSLTSGTSLTSSTSLTSEDDDEIDVLFRNRGDTVSVTTESSPTSETSEDQELNVIFVNDETSGTSVTSEDQELDVDFTDDDTSGTSITSVTSEDQELDVDFTNDDTSVTSETSGTSVTSETSATSTSDLVNEGPLEGATFVGAQVARVGTPLSGQWIVPADANAVLVDSSAPRNDAVLREFYETPTFPVYAAMNFPALENGAPRFLRDDLVQIYLRGVPGLTVPLRDQCTGANCGVVTADILRLNVSVAPTPRDDASRLGLLDEDLAGYPNGRRLGDDVVDIQLRAMFGAWCLEFDSLCPPNVEELAPFADVAFLDNAFVGECVFREEFPYLNSPVAGNRLLLEEVPSQIDEFCF